MTFIDHNYTLADRQANQVAIRRLIDLVNWFVLPSTGQRYDRVGMTTYVADYRPDLYIIATACACCGKSFEFTRTEAALRKHWYMPRHCSSDCTMHGGRTLDPVPVADVHSEAEKFVLSVIDRLPPGVSQMPPIDFLEVVVAAAPVPPGVVEGVVRDTRRGVYAGAIEELIKKRGRVRKHKDMLLFA